MAVGSEFPIGRGHVHRRVSLVVSLTQRVCADACAGCRRVEWSAGAGFAEPAQAVEVIAPGEVGGRDRLLVEFVAQLVPKRQPGRIRVAVESEANGRTLPPGVVTADTPPGDEGWLAQLGHRQPRLERPEREL